MATNYEVYGKIATAEKVEAIYGVRETKSEAFRYMMEEMGKHCNLTPELALVTRQGAPSPKYRNSVYQYLKKFFHQGKQLKVETIDYSDFKGQIRPFPPVRPAEDEAFATGYEQRMGIVEYHGYGGPDITEYDRQLGFIFSVSPTGLHVQFLDRNVRSSCMFQLCGEEYAFNYESGGMGRASVDLRVVKREGSIPARLESSAYPVMLLDILLNEREKRPIALRDLKEDSMADMDPGACLMWRLNSELYAKMNSAECTALSEIEVSSDRVKGYIDAIEKVGYCVKTETKKWFEFDSSGQKLVPVTKVERKYYIPPLICRDDADLILRSVQQANLPDKAVLVEKFTKESGYHRHAENPEEEAEMPLPNKTESWSPSCYSLMIFNILRLTDRALPVTFGAGENLQGLIEQYYGENMHRTTITKHISSLIAAGLPIEKVKRNYAIDRKKVLSASDLDVIKECIAHDDKLGDATKERLIHKLEEKFPIGKY